MSVMIDLLTVREAASQLGVSSSTVYRLISNGAISAVRVSDQVVRVRRQSVIDYLDPVGPELTVSQVAAILKISKSHVYSLVRQRRLRAISRGPRSMRILARHLESYIEIQSTDLD